MQRIFYIIPYNTILDQNAADIRSALGDSVSILEHHSDVAIPSEDEQLEYKTLTERWDSDVILTSLVRFLDACFGSGNTDARRLHRLADSVLVFDEIQSLPKHCKTLFERAVTFLASACGCTIVLCTATQPALNILPPPTEIMPDPQALYKRLERVKYEPKLDKALKNDEAAALIAQMLCQDSALTIVNTKQVTWNVYCAAMDAARAAGLTPVLPDAALDESKIRALAKQSGDNAVLCIHMSTLLCPAHRKRFLQWIKIWLSENARVLCVSTALIEAGINVSFPIVVRSLAGMPSIVQAAGRCNRSMEYGSGAVYVWEFAEEKLRRLPDIQNGGNITRAIAAHGGSDFGSLSVLDTYFKREEDYIGAIKNYPIKSLNASLSELLAGNEERLHESKTFGLNKELVLNQSFRTAYEHFAAIYQKTKAVIVPYGEGSKLIADLCGEHDMQNEMRLLRLAQSFSVNLFDAAFNRLARDGAIYAVGQSGAYALMPGYYDDAGGVVLEQRELSEMII